jgi:hypothetical protein
MSEGNGGPRRGRQALDEMKERRSRSDLIGGMRKLQRVAQSSEPVERPGSDPALRGDDERCDLCGTRIPFDHRHMLELFERRIDCVCESCWALRSGDDQYRPVGTRTLWLEDFEMSDELWAKFQIPIGLAFLFRSSAAEAVVSLYPSPAGATESGVDRTAWEELVALNPMLEHLAADGEALIVNRMSDPPEHAIAPIDECYRLVGLIKSTWEGISGGAAIEKAVPTFFAELRVKAALA